MHSVLYVCCATSSTTPSQSCMYVGIIKITLYYLCIYVHVCVCELLNHSPVGMYINYTSTSAIVCGALSQYICLCWTFCWGALYSTRHRVGQFAAHSDDIQAEVQQLVVE